MLCCLCQRNPKNPLTLAENSTLKGGKEGSKVKYLLPTAVELFLGLVVGNFLWQLMTGDPQWGVAAERSFFQFVALAAFIGVASPTVNRLARHQ